MRFSAV